MRQSKNTIKTTQLPLPAHVPALGFFPCCFSPPFSLLKSLALTCGSQTGYPCLGKLSMWAPCHPPPPRHPCALPTGQIIHGESGTVPPPSLTPLCAHIPLALLNAKTNQPFYLPAQLPRSPPPILCQPGTTLAAPWHPALMLLTTTSPHSHAHTPGSLQAAILGSRNSPWRQAQGFFLPFSPFLFF